MSDYDMQTMRQLQNDNRLLSAAEAEVRTLRAQLAEAVKWKQAITDAAVVSWTLTAENENDPVKAVNALLHNAQRIALDPLVCEEAARLRDTYKDQLAARDATIEALREECRAWRAAEDDENPHKYCDEIRRCSCAYHVHEYAKWTRIIAARIRTDELRALGEQAESVRQVEQHICGAHDFGRGIDDICPACESARLDAGKGKKDA